MSKGPQLRPAPQELPVNRAAFIGLGTMGMPMAKNLCRAGFEVVGHNRDEDRADEFREFGARWASSAAEAVERAHVVATDAARLAPRSSRSWQDRPEPLGRPNLAPS